MSKVVREIDMAELLRYHARYEWIRQHPAFETEALLGGLSPEEFDRLVDKRRSSDNETAV